MNRDDDKYIAKYDSTQRQLLAQARQQLNDIVVQVGQRLRPSIVKAAVWPGPAEDVDSPHATMLRGVRAITWWLGVLRTDITNRIPDAQDILGPPAFSLVCGMALGELCAVADSVGDKIPGDVEDIMSDVFEGGYILGRISMAQAIDRGVVSVEKDEKGVVKIITGDGSAVN